MIRSLKPWAVLAAFACVGLLAATPGFAQRYPTKPVRFMVPYSPGGNTDVLARLIAQRMSETFGQPVIVENRPAVDGIVGTEIVAKSPPDGYTFLMVSSSYAINLAIGHKLPYDTFRDLTSVAQTASQQLILVVHPSLPVKSVKELVDHAKAKPGILTYGTSSSATHLATELFNLLAGVKMIHVPYKGAAPMLNELLGGQTNLSLSPSVTALPHIKSGRLRALALGDSKRSSFMPDLPTIAESGVPGYQAVIWTGMLAPAKTPRPIIMQLNKEVVRIVRSPEIKDRLVALGSDVVGSTPEEFDAFVRAEVAKWTKIARQVNLKPGV